MKEREFVIPCVKEITKRAAFTPDDFIDTMAKTEKCANYVNLPVKPPLKEGYRIEYCKVLFQYRPCEGKKEKCPIPASYVPKPAK